MPALTLNGVTVPVASWQRLAPVTLGEALARGTSGRAISSSRKRKQKWQVKTTPLSQAEAAALRGMIEGRGRTWSFDSSLYDRTGLGPSGSHTGSIIGLFQKWGAGAVQVGPTSPTYLRYDVGASDEWTLMYWKRPLDFYYGLPSVNDHFIHTSSGSNYRNGAAFTPATSGSAHDRYVYATYGSGLVTLHSVVGVIPAFGGGTSYSIGDLAVTVGPFSGIIRVFAVSGGSGFPASEPDWDTAPSAEDTVSDGNLDWSNYDDDGFTFFDDLTFLPYAIPASWAAQLYAEHSTRAWTAQPDVRISGDLPGSARLVRGVVGEGDTIEHKRSGSFERAGESLGLTLTEAS
jgi:hypothetical protein